MFLTYSIKNEEHRRLLQKALDLLWERTWIERGDVKKGEKTVVEIKITPPKR